MLEEKFLTIKDVTDKVGFKTSTIYKYMKMGIFPKPVKFGKSSRWKLTDIEQWMKKIISR
jgi:predicted DNA-binding transcriptional regulator AlpA